ncbi:MAG: hypothetical protein K2L17_11015 [Muribaculaceae bacterium]|nr:hypothetical protein [Muribaculaceae bacterium]
MIPEEYKPLIDKISSVTDQKKFRWEKTSDEEKFLLNLGLNSVTIHYFEAYPDDSPTVGFEIRDRLGDRIDGIYISQDERDYDTMWELYRSARRNALKIGDTISNMMKFLED